MKKALFIVSLFVMLTACAPAQQTADIQSTATAIVQAGVALTQTALSTATPPPTLTPMAAMMYSTPTPTPIQQFLFIMTPNAIQVERWKEYQTELAKYVLSDAGTMFTNYEHALCEWDILGQSNQEVYVWAVCSDFNSLAEKPAVIYLEANGSIRDVEFVFHGYQWNSRIQERFPTDVQEKIHLYEAFEPGSSLSIGSTNMRKHLEYRRTHPEEPPLVVLSATPTPTPTP